MESARTGAMATTLAYAENLHARAHRKGKKRFKSKNERTDRQDTTRNPLFGTHATRRSTQDHELATRAIVKPEAFFPISGSLLLGNVWLLPGASAIVWRSTAKVVS